MEFEARTRPVIVQILLEFFYHFKTKIQILIYLLRIFLGYGNLKFEVSQKFSTIQWAAVRINCLFMIDPPQMDPLAAFSSPTYQGIWAYETY